MKQGIKKIHSEQLLKQVASDIIIPSFERFQHMMVTKPEVLRYTHQRSRVHPWFRPFRSWTTSLLVPVVIMALAVIVILPHSNDSFTEGNEVLIDEGNQELYMLYQEDAYTETIITNYVDQFLKIGEPDYQ